MVHEVIRKYWKGITKLKRAFKGPFNFVTRYRAITLQETLREHERHRWGPLQEHNDPDLILVAYGRPGL